mmetsp:Transcript_23525/g.59065  ORF Transcript_23525/g.59065 Transcript_23525/m.59065 type:complete len:244 (+) Transcript_23525:80-811(+)
MSRERSGGTIARTTGTWRAPLLGSCSDASPGHPERILARSSLPMLQLSRQRNMRWFPRTAPTSTSLHLVRDRLVHPSGSQSSAMRTRMNVRLSTVGGQKEESLRLSGTCNDAWGNATVSLRRFLRRNRLSGMVSTSARLVTSSGRIVGRGRPLQRTISALVQVRLAHSTRWRFLGCRRRVVVWPRATSSMLRCVGGQHLRGISGGRCIRAQSVGKHVALVGGSSHACRNGRPNACSTGGGAAF